MIYHNKEFPRGYQRMSQRRGRFKGIIGPATSRLYTKRIIEQVFAETQKDFDNGWNHNESPDSAFW